MTPGCPQEPDNKTRLLKILWVLAIKHREIKLVVIRKLSPCWLDFILLKGIMQAAGRRLSPKIYPFWTQWTTIMNGVVTYAHECNSDTDFIDVTNPFPSAFKISSAVENACLMLKIWPWAREELRDPSTKANTIILLNRVLNYSPNLSLSFYTLMTLSDIIREDSLCSGL